MPFVDDKLEKEEEIYDHHLLQLL